ncbi:MAG: CvpA family protein [Oscillospiraceae bacterium]|nr:CvpA family protein [Oscillospiraceae bacterium]
MNLHNAALIADIVLVLIVVIAVIGGGRQGAIKKLSKIAALICGVLAGNFIKKTFARRLSDGLIKPFVDNILKGAEQSVNFGKIASDISSEAGQGAAAADIPDLSGVDLSGLGLSDIKIPGVDLQNVISGMKIDKTIGDLTANIRASVSEAVKNAADTLSLNFAGVILFVLTALIVFILVKLILKKLLSPLVSSIPIVGGIDKLLGAVLGAAEGLLIAGLLLFVAYKVSPLLPQAVQKVFEPQAIENSFVVKQFFLRLPGIFTPVK